MRLVLALWVFVASLAGAAGVGPATPAPGGTEVDAAERYNTGLVYKSGRNWTKAEAAFREATKADPDMVAAWSELGHALKMQQRYDDAIRTYQEALRREPNFAAAIEYLGEAYAAQGKQAEAAAQLEKLKPLDAALAKRLEAAIANGGKGDW